MSENTKQNYLNHPKGIMSWLLTVDHKRIGLMYLVSGILFFFIGGLLALVMRFELAAPGNDIISNDIYNNAYTLHGAIMIFLFIIPAIPGALGNILLPLMVGAKDVAFPRLNLASFYIYSFGALFALYTIVNGGVDTGWTFDTPYSTQSSSNVVPMTLGIFIIGFSLWLLSRKIAEYSSINTSNGRSALVSSYVLQTTLIVDGIFILLAIVQPNLSGLV